MSSLADRVRGIVGTTDPESRVPIESRIPNPEPRDLSPLGGEWRDACFVVEWRWDPFVRHGREAIGTFARGLEDAASHASWFAGGAPARAPFVFLDLETTGLSGGAGTHAFLIGCGWFDADGGFVTRQLVLTRYAGERPLLETAAAVLGGAGAIVSFNGKSFDAPVLETRYLFHRLEWVGAKVPHVDILHPARRFWGAFGADTDCSLTGLEQRVVGARRVGDVPSFEIPSRYFQFVRSGDARLLVGVLEHNRLDLLTLAALTARLLHLARIGPDGARDAREALALGRVYARAGLDARARDAFQRAVDLSAPGEIKIESLRALALALRRGRQYEDAAGCWLRLLGVAGCPGHIAREATEALAIHHEHRVRNLVAARTFALQSLETALPPGWTRAVRHRLARIERKMEQVSRLNFQVSSTFEP